MSRIGRPTPDPGPCPDLSTYDSSVGGPAAYEWLLSDHPWAVHERRRRAAAHHERELADAARVREWSDRTAAADLSGVSEQFAASLSRLAASMRPLADRTHTRVSVESAVPDELAVVEDRRRLETSRQVDGDEDYRYPAHLIGPGAAGYPPPGWTPPAENGADQ